MVHAMRAASISATGSILAGETSASVKGSVPSGALMQVSGNVPVNVEVTSSAKHRAYDKVSCAIRNLPRRCAAIGSVPAACLRSILLVACMIVANLLS